MISSRLKKILFVVYATLAVFLYFYVPNVLKGVPVSVATPDEDTNQEHKVVSVILKVSGQSTDREYKLELKDNDSLKDMLLNTREDYPGFTYELTQYSYEYSIDSVMNVSSNKSYSWDLQDSMENSLLPSLDSKSVEDGATYYLVYKKIF